MEDETKQEVITSLAKSLFSAIPYVGGVLNEIAFDYRSRIKQNRLNSFIQLLSEFFLKHQNIPVENLKNEAFSDLFEVVVLKVLQTRSEKKHIRFRDILINQMRSPERDIEYVDGFLELINSLNEITISILKEHQDFFYEMKRIEPLRQIALDDATTAQDQLNTALQDYQTTENNILELQNLGLKHKLAVEKYNEEVLSLQDFRSAEFYRISEADWLYYKQTLYSRGLLIDNGAGTYSGTHFQYMSITEYGNKFLDFLKIEDF